MTKDEVLKLALAVLKSKDVCGSSIREAKEKAIAAAEEALAQPERDLDAGATIDERWYITRKPEQETVARYVYKPTLPRGHLGNVSDGDLPWVYDQDPSSGYTARMLVYTTPPQRKPLTDEEINKLVDDEDWYNDPHGFARAIEVAHSIKE